MRSLREANIPNSHVRPSIGAKTAMLRTPALKLYNISLILLILLHFASLLLLFVISLKRKMYPLLSKSHVLILFICLYIIWFFNHKQHILVLYALLKDLLFCKIRKRPIVSVCLFVLLL